MNKNLIKNSAMTALMLMPLAYLAFIWPTVPQTIPTHIGVHGPDAWGDKTTLFIPTTVLALAGMIAYYLLLYIQKIDPKRAAKPISPAFRKLGMGIAFFMVCLNFILIRMFAKNDHLDNMVLTLIGLLFAFLGNVMHQIKPNYFVGIRLPWTLSSDDNWRRTHQIAGKIWFGGGILLALLGLFVPVLIGATILPIFIFIMVLIPSIFSFRLYQKDKNKRALEN